MKSWLIATRFVKEGSKVLPEQLIYDPNTEGELINDNEYSSLNSYIAKEHLSDSLFRISQFRLGSMVRGDLKKGDSLQIMTWQCIIKGIDHLTFVGGPMNQQCYPWLWDDLFFRRAPDFWDNYVSCIESLNGNLLFDGIVINVIQDFLKGTYTRFEFNDVDYENYPFISLLPDGNILIPLSLMKPGKIMSIG